ncbi:MAG: PHP domain-containing protein [Candidatus Nealsonbacteria bacterium]
MLRVDLHIHSIASGHAFNTIFELSYFAGQKGVEMIGVTDHGPSMKGAPHIGYFEMMKKIPRELNGVKIITGCEANIINLEGDIDLPIEVQEQLDLVIVGLHERTPFPKKTTLLENTQAIINAIKKNRVHIISHPYRLEFPVDIEKIFAVAKEKGVLLEVNLSLLNRCAASKELLDQVRLIVERADFYKEKIIVATDAHIANEIGDDSILKSVGLKIPDELILGKQEGAIEVERFLKRKKLLS